MKRLLSRAIGRASARMICAFAVLALVGSAVGCGTLVAGFRVAPPHRETEQQRRRQAAELGPFRNNTTYRAGPGVYAGDLVIHGNKVVLVGAGVESTIFSGDVIISGNSCVLRDLAIRGDLRVNGNNNDVRRVRVHGRVRINGNNNRW